MNHGLVNLLEDLAAAKHSDLSIAADAADEIRRLRAAAKKAIDHAERNGMADWPVFRNLRKALV